MFWNSLAVGNGRLVEPTHRRLCKVSSDIGNEDQSQDVPESCSFLSFLLTLVGPACFEDRRLTALLLVTGAGDWMTGAIDAVDG